MRSSLFKHIWLIQPHDPPPSAIIVDAAGGATVRFVPTWSLVCLQSFLLERTGHTCSIIDTRLNDSLADALEPLRRPLDDKAESVAVVHAETSALGHVGAITRYLHTQHPDITIIVCGPFADSFPELVRLIPHVDYGLRGDAEAILRNLLDYKSIPHRLKLVPGLITPDDPAKNPHWIERLQSLSLPEWYRVDWSAYASQDVHRALRAEVRLSRGMAPGPASLPYGKPDEPLRVWSLAAMAQAFQKCAGQGISEIYLSDPPSFWTDEQLRDWCRQLILCRNTQPWAIQLFPRQLESEIIAALGENACHRIEFIMPSCDPDLAARYGVDISVEALAGQIAALAKHNVQAQVIYWLQGPDERAEGEAERIYRHLSGLSFPRFALHPFPLHHDSRLYRERAGRDPGTPDVMKWVEWAQHPDMPNPPVSMWDGVNGQTRCRATSMAIQRKITRNPRRRISRILQSIHLYGSIKRFEQRIADWFTARARPPAIRP